jgi:hypothetical protein
MLNTNERAAQLRAIARSYVENGLGKGNFDAIPYAADVILRAPLCPGGSGVPLIGRENLRHEWWAPLPRLVTGVEVIETYVNAGLTTAAVEFLCHIAEPRCTLRVIDRFQISDTGLITDQENFFDPSQLAKAKHSSR